MIGKKIGDTDYCLSWIPIGGYVKLAGMIDEILKYHVERIDYVELGDSHDSFISFIPKALSLLKMFTGAYYAAQYGHPELTACS